MTEFRFFAYTDFEFHTNRSQNLLNLPITPFRPTKHTTTDEISHELNIPYTVFEILVAVFAVIGNLMVIIVFQRERKLRRRTNYYIVSLAMADFLVGSLGVPFAILASIGMPTNLYACLFTVSLLVVLCTCSIFCLVAVSVDRYWAILYPMAYSRNVRTKTAIVIISMCWLAGAFVGFLPLFGWHADVGPNQACLFVEVMDYNYLVFLYFATIITPALIMLAFYMHIYRVIVKQVQQIVTMNPMGDFGHRSSSAQIHMTSPGRGYHGGTMLRVLGAARKRDVKATQNLSIIVLFFMICWIPLYTINCIKAFCPACDVHPKLTLFCIILSHLNSAVNPVLYAYHLKDFRAALKNLILKIIGIEVDPRMDAIHRYSLASHHRLQSLDASVRHSLQPRIYIDSPIWLRQQQQTLKKTQTLPKCGTVSPCLGNGIGTIHQTVSAVASVPADIEHEVWNIMEASSGAELADNHYQFSDIEDDGDINQSNGNGNSTPPIAAHHRYHYQRGSSLKPDGFESPLYSYDNRNYSKHPPNDSDTDYDEVFLPTVTVTSAAIDPDQLNSSLIACAMREKLRSSESEYQKRLDSPQRALTDSSSSDYEQSKQSSSQESPAAMIPRRKQTNQFSQSPLKCFVPPKPASTECSSNICTAVKAASSVFFIDSRISGTRKINKRSCASDSSSPKQQLTLNGKKNGRHNSSHNSNSGSSSTHSVGVIGNHYNNNNNNSNLHNTTNNLNYFTIHHHPTHHHKHQQLFHQQQPHLEKFSPLKAMSNFIFPPAVKHSSLFQLFQPFNSTTDSSATATMTAPATRKSQQLVDNFAAVDDSTSVAAMDLVVDQYETNAVSAASS